MNGFHLQSSQPMNGETSVLDTRGNSTSSERPTLSNLAGELQNLVIGHLDLPAAARLSQTNRHFSACVNIPLSAIISYLRNKELSAGRTDDFACYTCLRLKPRSSFGKRQTRGKNGKNGQNPTGRFCLDCASEHRRYAPGNTLEINGKWQVCCYDCETLQKRFCTRCRWCDGCIGKGTVTVRRKGEWATPDDRADEVSMRNVCEGHDWKEPEQRSAGPVSRSTRRGPRTTPKATGLIANPEWYDGPDDICKTGAKGDECRSTPGLQHDALPFWFPDCVEGEAIGIGASA